MIARNLMLVALLGASTQVYGMENQQKETKEEIEKKNDILEEKIDLKKIQKASDDSQLLTRGSLFSKSPNDKLLRGIEELVKPVPEGILGLAEKIDKLGEQSKNWATKDDFEKFQNTLLEAIAKKKKDPKDLTFVQLMLCNNQKPANDTEGKIVKALMLLHKKDLTEEEKKDWVDKHIEKKDDAQKSDLSLCSTPNLKKATPMLLVPAVILAIGFLTFKKH